MKARIFSAAVAATLLASSGAMAAEYTNIVIEKDVNASLAGMKKSGWQRSDTKIVKIWPFSNNHGLLMADIVRYKTDGTILNKGRYCYSMRRAGELWQICAVTDVGEAFAGPGAGDIARLYKA